MQNESQRSRRRRYTEICLKGMDNTKFVVRKVLYDLIDRKQFATLNILTQEMKNKKIIDIGRSILYCVLQTNEI